MDLFSRFNNYPIDSAQRPSLDSYIDFSEKEAIYPILESCLNQCSQLIHDKYLPTLSLSCGNGFMFHTFKQLPNLLFKVMTLQKVANTFPDRIVLNCFEEELDYYDAEKSINRLASIYALIAERMPTIFEVKNIGKHQFKIPQIKNTSISNPILRFSNVPIEVLWVKISRLSLKRLKCRPGKTIFVAGQNGLINEILSKSGSRFEYVEIYDRLLRVYDSAPLTKVVSEDEIKIIFDESFRVSRDSIGLNRAFYQVFCDIAVEILNHKVNKLINSAPLLYQAVGELKERYKASVILSDGLYAIPGIAISNALRKNGIRIISAEHGLTAGISKWRTRTINYNEPNTCDVIMTYNKMSTATFLSSSNKNLKCVECGAPQETKKLRYYRLQRIVSRKRLKVQSVTVFYVSTNLLTNNNCFFPHYSPDHIRDRVETSLLDNVLSNVNKRVIYKYYPSQNYLYDENPYAKRAKLIPNIVVSEEEDFRYIRSAADVIMTSAPFSTLGWCVGLDKPIVYLDSPMFQPLENDLVSKAFDECFFVFNIDLVGWEQRLLEFLNKSFEEIESRWQEKSRYRKQYDNIYFLNRGKNAGQVGADFISNII
tara:strand:- start:4225 stop:6012 length:1788 start_codon:yes stop_codon:yes gene_type:complete